jgi:DNA mismatch repair protein MutL
VDVNVHPTKLEVRFQDGGRVYSQLLGTLRTKFLSTDLVARGALTIAGVAAPDEPAAAPDASDLWEWAKRQLGPASEASQSDAFRAHSLGAGEGLKLHPFDVGSSAANRQSNPNGTLSPLPSSPRLGEEAGAIKLQAVRHDGGHSATPAPRALQIHNRYLVTETADGLEVIDQHALHERILYETLRERVLAGAVESQRLLVPEPVDLPASEAAAAVEHRDLLAQLGVEVEPFGGETVLIAAYPAMLANFQPADVLRSIVDRLVAGGRDPEPRDVLDELLHMIACKAAVKYGDRLTPQEIDALLEHRGLAQDHHHCPHGRPTALVFTREQLDRQFKRI